jgi:hypothetical protein
LQKHDIQAVEQPLVEVTFLGAQSRDVFKDQRACLTARKLERRLRRLPEIRFADVRPHLDERSTGCLDRAFNEHIVAPRLQNQRFGGMPMRQQCVFSFIECPLGTLALENDGLGQ